MPRNPHPDAPRFASPLVHFARVLGAVALAVLAAASSAFGQAGTIWHVPNNSSDLGGTTMRSPLTGINALTPSVTLYQGVNRADGTNQTGGALLWRPLGGGSWQSIGLVFDRNVGSLQFWRAALPFATLPPGSAVEYYIRVNFSNVAGGSRFLFGTDASTNTTTDEGAAQASPYVIRPDPFLTVAGRNADYTTTKFFLNEVTGAVSPGGTLEVFFAPGQHHTIEPGSVQVFTNLNRRDRADDDANGDGIHDGILPPDGNLIPAGDGSHYYQATVLPPVDGTPGYRASLPIARTGAYRLTARWRNIGDAANTWRWYSGPGTPRRDHAVVVSPDTARDIRLYELNVFNIESSGTLFSQRSTFEDLSDRPGRLHTAPGRPNQFNLDYLRQLGMNWIWFQPYHPYGWEGRHLSAANINARSPGANADTWVRPPSGSPYLDVNYPFALGSPYAVRSFWEVEPRMTATFVGLENSETDVSSIANRERAMTAFRNFAADADAAGIALMPDAAFNHTAWDVEVGPVGLETWMVAQGATGWNARDFLRSRELRAFSRRGDYAQRATFYTDFFNNNIAPAPDRGDFGKWLDVTDLFFGRYAALVSQNPADNNNYNSEGDWIDLSLATGNFDAITRATWMTFARYAPYWLERTRAPGSNRNSLPADGTAAERLAWDARGIDGLRCDFGQGLPPQAWEYIINVARSYKWSFVFMAETLDGGAPPYRSNRHFDILNENILFAVKGAGTTTAFRGILEERRNAFGLGLVLLNTVSHDEDNYSDPWVPLRNYAVLSTVDGAPMVFPGQELGIYTRPNGSFAGGVENFGYDLYEKNFGKYIPHFKTYNSMMPAWGVTDFRTNQLRHVYAAINRARAASPALRGSERFFLNPLGSGSADEQIWAVARFERRNESPATQDVVFAFANLNLGGPENNVFAVAVDTDNDGQNDFGLRPDRLYNVRNLAAYTNLVPGRDQTWLWGQGRTGLEVLTAGLPVSLNGLPAQFGGNWTDFPFEAQYLKLFEADPTNPASDFDGDGLSDGGEVTAGTHAFDPSSNLRITTVVPAVGSGFSITWTSVPGRTYVLEYRSSLTSGTWMTAIPSVPAAAGATTTVDHTPPSAGGHYRVRVLPGS